MKNPTTTFDRRSFIQRSALIGAGLLVGNRNLSAERGESGMAHLRGYPESLSSFPDRAYVTHEAGALSALVKEANGFSSKKVRVKLNSQERGTEVVVSCPSAALSRIVLRWDVTFPDETLFMGDAWERGYGDLQWRFCQPERMLPWYFAGHHQGSNRTFCAGVLTQPSTFCAWVVDNSGVSLWIDFRNGGSPCIPGNREIVAATYISQASAGEETPFAALKRFCRSLCNKPLKSSGPICGNNNWYYAYGTNFNADTMRRDASFLSEISDGAKHRPYCVIDAGWSPGGGCPGGPWTAGKAESFPDMPGLAYDMKQIGVRPGIWMRPTALTTVVDPSRLRGGPCSVPEKPLDLTMPENLELIRTDVARVENWGYQLIKHDFSTYDIFGRWGFEMGMEMTDSGWSFADRSKTNAEVILELYRTIRRGANSAVLIGCNTVGHLGAGLFECQRTGDDTSGRIWERTRRMGINTMAYRLAQNGSFFSCDPDCAAHTENTPWGQDFQFLDLASRSGCALFISTDPLKTTPDQKQAFKTAMLRALKTETSPEVEPIDWLYSTAPRKWRFGSEMKTYQWDEATGAIPLRV